MWTTRREEESRSDMFFKLRCLWRTLPNTDAKLEEEVNNEAEVMLLEEDFAKALKQQILL